MRPLRVGMQTTSLDLTHPCIAIPCPSAAEGPFPAGKPATGARPKPCETRRREGNQEALRLPLARPLSIRGTNLSNGSTVCLPYAKADTPRAGSATRHGYAVQAPASPPNQPLAPSSFATVARPLNRLHLRRLRNLKHKSTVRRYVKARPSYLIHIDDKSKSRFRKVGHRISSDIEQARVYSVEQKTSIWPSMTQPPRLYRGVGGLAEASGDRIPRPKNCLVQLTGHRVPSGDKQHEPSLLFQSTRQDLLHPMLEAHPQQSVHAPHVRRSRTDNLELVPRVEVRRGLPELGTAQPLDA
jgi:hypothetical protein